ncbi:MAG TPA: TIGR02147 family protein [Fibrobacteria bacterium]|nr:TIGR02147 family protein [Fibrobacteria bacterium]
MSPPAAQHPSATQPSAIRIFDYLDYRAFLKDSYQARKRANASFSFRYIGKKVDLDGGTVRHLFKGERNLNPALAGKLARVFGLNNRERIFFEILVLFGQARSQAEKNHFLEKLFRLRDLKVKTLEERQHEYYRAWYHMAMRELLNFHPFDGDYQALGRMLQPAISPAEAKSALQVLLDVGLVEKDAEDGLRLTDKTITSGEGIRSLSLKNAQRTMAELACRALDDVPAPERDISGITFSLSAQGAERIKARLRECRRDLIEIAQRDQDPDRVYRMNLQFFPLSRKRGEAKEANG